MKETDYVSPDFSVSGQNLLVCLWQYVIFAKKIGNATFEIEIGRFQA